MGLLGVLCTLLALLALLIWMQFRIVKLEEELETFREIVTEDMKKTRKDVDDLADFSKNTTKTVGLLIDEMRGKSRN